MIRCEFLLFPERKFCCRGYMFGNLVTDLSLTMLCRSFREEFISSKDCDLNSSKGLCVVFNILYHVSASRELHKPRNFKLIKSL